MRPSGFVIQMQKHNHRTDFESVTTAKGLRFSAFCCRAIGGHWGPLVLPGSDNVARCRWMHLRNFDPFLP